MKLPASLGRFISQLCRVSNIGLVSFAGYNKIVVKNVSIKSGSNGNPNCPNAPNPNRRTIAFNKERS